jgi:hypothetical protein
LISIATSGFPPRSKGKVNFSTVFGSAKVGGAATLSDSNQVFDSESFPAGTSDGRTTRIVSVRRWTGWIGPFDIL